MVQDRQVSRVTAQWAEKALSDMTKPVLVLGTLWVTLLLGCTGSEVGEPGDGSTAVTGSALTYVDSLERAHCERLFECPRSTEAEVTERMMAGSVEQCVLNQQALRQTEPDRKAMVDGIASGELTLNRMAADECLSAIGSCELASTNVSHETQTLYCRLALKGQTLTGQSCQNDLQCAGDSYCAGGCPGTCQPRRALGEVCASDNECAGVEQLVSCQAETFDAVPVCVAFSVEFAAREGEACVPWEYAGSKLVPCARGLWCRLYELNSSTGVCAPAIMPGGPCEHEHDVCSGTEICGKGQCTEQEPRSQGQSCDMWPNLCDIKKGLVCWEGTCQPMVSSSPSELGCDGGDCSGAYCGPVDLISEPR
jgi:hypothetical protein